MNVHHLELFYYVARHGGIAKAVRNMPYGIQQPAVSGQIARLEEHLGVTLFQRQPFSLTPPGRKLFEFIEPFFSNLPDMELEMQGGKARRLRIGASTIVLREYVPGLLRHLRKKFPQLKIGLREGHQPALESLLANDQLDLAVTVLEKKPGSGIHSLPLIELPLVLLVSKDNKITSAEQLWQQDKIKNLSFVCLNQKRSAKTSKRLWPKLAWTGFQALRSAVWIWWPSMPPAAWASACPWIFPNMITHPKSESSPYRNFLQL